MMKRSGLGLPLLALLAGCITTDDRSGDRGVDNGFWRREGLASWRILTSPATIASAAVAPFRVETISTGRATFLCPYMTLWGAGETVEELAVGLTELVSGHQFKSCAYPLERFDLDVADWKAESTKARHAGEDDVQNAPLADARSDGFENSREALGVRAACERDDWKTATKLLRLYYAAKKECRAKALMGVRLAMASWNAGDRIGAIVAADAVVSLCETSGTCPPGVERLRNGFRKGTAPKSFSVDAIMFAGGGLGILQGDSRPAERN